GKAICAPGGLGLAQRDGALLGPQVSLGCQAPDVVGRGAPFTRNRRRRPPRPAAWAGLPWNSRSRAVGWKGGSGGARRGRWALTTLALERDVAVGIGVGAGRTRRLSAGRPLSIAPAVEKGQHAVVRREMDLRGVALDARLVLPL